MILGTERLTLRELTMDDLDDLYSILSDPESMQHYPKAFTLEEAVDWINRNIDRYMEHGFGLWAVELKSDGTFIGDCGITLQNINGNIVPEIGYHINRQFTNNGYATEAAQACRDYGFDTLGFKKVYSYMKFSNLPSARVAEKNGMKLEYEYDDSVNTVTKVYSITIEEYRNLSAK